MGLKETKTIWPFSDNPLTVPENKLPRGPNGRKLCRCGCGRECPPPRRTFFSDTCLRAYENATNWNFISRRMRRIKNHTCEVCGVNMREFRSNVGQLYFTIGREKYEELRKCLKQEGLGKGEWLHVHHITPRSKGGTHHPDNLLVVCVGCHKELHRGKNENQIWKNEGEING